MHRSVDVAVLDLQMPGLDGIGVAEALVDGAARLRLGHRDQPRPPRSPQAGAVGRRARLPAEDDVRSHPRAGGADRARGGRYVDPDLATEAIAAGDSPLTPREADVLELAADGAPVDEIAARASLSPGTVRNYLSSAITKLGAANRHDACTIARRTGWI